MPTPPPIPWAKIAFACMLLAALAFVLATCGAARAHSFYDTWCCSGEDCRPAPAGTVTWTPAGWSVGATHETVPFDDTRLRVTPPGEPAFHICIVPGQPRLRCLYVPQPEG